MSDFKSLFTLDDWRSYRKKQIAVVSDVIEKAMYNVFHGGAQNMDDLRGMLSMARLLIRLPSELTRDEELRALLDRQLIEDMACLTTDLIRKRLTDE